MRNQGNNRSGDDAEVDQFLGERRKGMNEIVSPEMYHGSRVLIFGSKGPSAA